MANTRPACALHELNGGHHEPCAHCQNAVLRAERDQYRIEADCAMRDYDALELEAGVLRDALRGIAENAEAHHGDNEAKGRSLAVIATGARAALASVELVP